jgi:hypothetical protein
VECDDQREWLIGVYQCGKFNVRVTVVTVLAGLFSSALFGIVLCYTHCLKKRLVKGRPQYVCRKATKRCYCLYKRPRSYEEH